MQYKCDGQTDGQTNNFRTTVKYRAIASRGKSIRNKIVAFEFQNLASWRVDTVGDRRF